MATKIERTKAGTFEEFKALTLAVARGECTIDLNEPRIWIEARDSEREQNTPGDTD